MDNKIECIIFCGGKCGGSTLFKTINKYTKNVIHLHSFTCNGLHNNKHIKYELGKENITNLISYSQKHYKKIYIIDSYRTPIERKISSFFQNLHLHIPDYENKSVEDLIEIFNKKYLNNIEEYHPINQILNYYNIPLIETFDFNKKYTLIEKDNIVFVKLLLKNSNNWEEILSKIFKRQIVVEKNNIGFEKKNSNLYKQFQKKYLVPENYIKNLLTNDKEFKIYNTQEEQQIYINKWLKKSKKY